MKPIKVPLLLVSAALLAGGGGVLWAQNYSVKWSRIAGGSGTTSSQYTLTGTIGQHDAGAHMTNSRYSVTGGFWAVALVQTPGAPTLHITSSLPGFLTIWWTPATPGFVLQSSGSLKPVNWVDAPSGASNPVTVPAAGPMRFYRLSKP